VTFNEAYKMWVGAELCTASSYKLYLGASKGGVFYPISDGGGHGQDHCELVNPTFTLPNDDDITSGTCKDCSVDPYPLWTWPGAKGNYTRSHTDEPFTFEASWLRWEVPNGQPMTPHMTSRVYECGVSIP